MAFYDALMSAKSRATSGRRVYRLAAAVDAEPQARGRVGALHL